MKTTRQMTAIIEREDEGYVALCPELDIASQGDTVESARQNFEYPAASGTRLRWLIPCALGAAAIVTVAGSALFGWFPVVRLSAVLLPVLAAGVIAAAPWRWRDDDWSRVAGWAPSGRTPGAGAAAAAALLLWIVYSRFQAGGISAVDFTIYFDRPLYQTGLGRWYFVESTDVHEVPTDAAPE